MDYPDTDSISPIDFLTDETYYMIHDLGHKNGHSRTHGFSAAGEKRRAFLQQLNEIRALNEYKPTN